MITDVLISAIFSSNYSKILGLSKSYYNLSSKNLEINFKPSVFHALWMIFHMMIFQNWIYV